MIDEGLEDEVRSLADMGCTSDMTSMQGIGYKQMLMYINGETGRDEAIDLIKRDSRHFAKRQLTWFKRERDTVWIDREGRSSADIADRLTYDYSAMDQNGKQT